MINSISLLSALFCCVTLIAFRSNILRHFLNRIVYSSISIVPSSVYLQCRHVPPSVHYLIPPQPPSVHYLIPPQPLSYPPQAPQCTVSNTYPHSPPVYIIHYTRTPTETGSVQGRPVAGGPPGCQGEGVLGDQTRDPQHTL